MLAFDLDPGPSAGISECCEVARILRDALGQIGLECFPKTSGSKGIQVYAPLNDEGVSYDDTKPLANALARHLENEHPELIVSSQKKELRHGKVLIDWSQNDAQQDDRLRLLAAGARAADGLDAGSLGGARRPDRAQLRDRRRARADRASTAICSRPWRSCSRSCRASQRRPLA